jgi:hypothetical protein
MSSRKWIVHAEKVQHGLWQLILHLPGLDFADAVNSFITRVRDSCGLPGKIMVVDHMSLQFNVVDWTPLKQQVSLQALLQHAAIKKMLKSIFKQTTDAQLRNCMEDDDFDATVDSF